MDENKKTEETCGIDLAEVCRMGLLPELAEQYIALCAKNADGDKKHRSGAKGTRFPNIAGFCRYCGVGHAELEKLKEFFPKEYDALCSVFEDEALNSDIAVSLLGTYMKTRLGYGAKEKEVCSSEEDEPTVAVFEHDIFEDGG